MFTGLIEATGLVETVRVEGGGRWMFVSTPLGSELAAGDSVAVNGICLTATHVEARGFQAQVSPQTVAVTTAGSWTPGRMVNLERPVLAGARLGGHFVLGHVDGVGRVVELRVEGDYRWLEVAVPPSLAPLLIDKGSVAIDGISLTIALLAETRIGLQIVPFTFEHTALVAALADDVVNLEADVLGKYVQRLLSFGPAGASQLASAGGARL